MTSPSWGPDYDPKRDAPRLSRQLARIRDLMLRSGWLTLAEIERILGPGHPQASISAQLRHLRQKRYGGYDVEKRRRNEDGGTWEYRVRERFQLRP